MATDPASGRSVEVDTHRTGTVVMWGLGAFLNLSEGRSFRYDLAPALAVVVELGAGAPHLRRQHRVDNVRGPCPVP